MKVDSIEWRVVDSNPLPKLKFDSIHNIISGFLKKNKIKCIQQTHC